MTERPKGGPIRRKAGARRAEREARRSSLQAQLKPSVDKIGATAASASEPVVAKPPEPPAEKAPVGRRVFDPTGGRRSPAPKPRAPVKPERPVEAKAPVVTKPNPEEIARQQEAARELAADKGIPQVHALRVIRGEVSLAIVLKGLQRKERATRLIESDGLEPGLAGQVASGHLSRERALELQRIRMFRKERIDRDALKLAELNTAEVAVGCFDGSWFVGKVAEARTYEVDFVLTEGDETRLILYALQSQAELGPCEPRSRWGMSAEDRAKHETWANLGKMEPHEAMRLFVKLLDDEPYSNRRWALAGGVSTADLNTLELEAAKLFQFSLYCTVDAVDAMRDELLPRPLPPSCPPLPPPPSVLQCAAAMESESATVSAL